MRRYTIILLAVIIFLGLGTLYVLIDKELYYYGRNNLDCHSNILPLGFNPSFWGSDVSFPIKGFILKDSYGFLRIGKDKSYSFNYASIKIVEVINYGYNESNIISLVRTENGGYYYIEFHRKEGESSMDEIQYVIIKRGEKGDLYNYNWIEIRDDEHNINLLLRFRILIIFVLLFLIPVYLFINKVYKEKNKASNLNDPISSGKLKNGKD